MKLRDADVLVPTSPDEAVRAFGDGAGVTVVGGGTILMAELAMGRFRPERALLLARAGLDTITRENGTVLIGAAVPVARLVDEAPRPLSTYARNVADYEVRAQATIGGNLCASPGRDAPRGDLQAPLLALGARVRSAGAGGERTDAIDDFLGTEDRLVLALEVDDPTRAGSASLRRPHAHAYSILSVAWAETGGSVRVAVAGAGPRAARCPSVERALADGADAADAAGHVLDDVEPADDALASAWYRKRMLPKLVAQALEER